MRAACGARAEDLGSLPLDFHLVEVPDGAENWKANYLQFFYKQQMLSRLADFAPDDAGAGLSGCVEASRITAC